MKKVSYKNRYNDVYTFTKVENGDILMEGSFEWMRCGYPNVYDRAYDAYKNDHPSDPVISLEEFKVAVHEYENETFDYTPFSKKYQDLV